VKRIDVDRARRLMDRGAQLIDVLPEPVYRQEHLPGAMNRPLQTMDCDAVSDLDTDRAVVVYCFDQH
jgi:rhodanese-related sulfurtransferase